MKFADFLAAFSKEPEDEGARELAFGLVSQVPTLGQIDGLDWLEHLQRGEVGKAFFTRMPDFDDIAVAEFEMQLFEAVLARLGELRVPNRLEAESEFILESVSDGYSIDIPRGYLLGLYKTWIESDFVPGIGNYLEQVSEKAKPLERVAIAKLIQAADGEASEAFLVRWLKLTVADALRIEPKLLPNWLSLLERETHDDEAVATAGYYRRLLVPLLLLDELPKPIREHLESTMLEPARAIAAHSFLVDYSMDHVRLPKSVLARTLERDMAVLQGRLPNHLEGVCCDKAKELLQDYRRLETAGGASLLSACAHLTLAIELELKWALGRGCDKPTVNKIDSQGLSSLARFLEGRTNDLSDLRPTSPPAERTVKLLRRVAEIRNTLHHKFRDIRSESRRELRRMIFDADSQAPRLMEKIAELRTTIQ